MCDNGPFGWVMDGVFGGPLICSSDNADTVMQPSYRIDDIHCMRTLKQYPSSIIYLNIVNRLILSREM